MCGPNMGGAGSGANPHPLAGVANRMNGMAAQAAGRTPAPETWQRAGPTPAPAGGLVPEAPVPFGVAPRSGGGYINGPR